MAVDYRGNTANLYFRTSSKITRGESERFISMADGKQPGSSSLFSDMERFTPPDGYTFSVTMTVSKGDIQRVAFYALKLPPASSDVTGSAGR